MYEVGRREATKWCQRWSGTLVTGTRLKRGSDGPLDFCFIFWAARGVATARAEAERVRNTCILPFKTLFHVLHAFAQKWSKTLRKTDGFANGT